MSVLTERAFASAFSLRNKRKFESEKSITPETQKSVNKTSSVRQNSGKSKQSLSEVAREDAEMDRDAENSSKKSRRQIARVAAPSPGTKRCCKKDLQRVLQIGEILELTRAEQHYLNEYNNGEKIRARFTGNGFYDLSKNMTYRSLSQWVKKRLVDVGALGVNSNISGWDFVAVKRGGKNVALRILIDSEEEEGSSNEIEVDSRDQSPALIPTSFSGNVNNQFSIAERMAQLCQQPESSSNSSSPGAATARTADELTALCKSLREELNNARVYSDKIREQLVVCENQLKSIQKHEYSLRERE